MDVSMENKGIVPLGCADVIPNQPSKGQISLTHRIQYCLEQNNRRLLEPL